MTNGYGWCVFKFLHELLRLDYFPLGGKRLYNLPGTSWTCKTGISTSSLLVRLLLPKVAGAGGRQPPYNRLCWVILHQFQLLNPLKVSHLFFCDLYFNPELKVLPIKFHLSIQDSKTLWSFKYLQVRRVHLKILSIPPVLTTLPMSHCPQNFSECSLHMHRSATNIKWIIRINQQQGLKPVRRTSFKTSF